VHDVLILLDPTAKAPGIDLISIQRTCAPILCQPLHHLFTSIRMYSFKLEIPKDTTNLQSWKYNKLSGYSNQFGFIKGASTLQQLLQSFG